jgi:hypothetical protein
VAVIWPVAERPLNLIVAIPFAGVVMVRCARIASGTVTVFWVRVELRGEYIVRTSGIGVAIWLLTAA